jgi:outer membrane protein OmpA-like peptidoglycan-associated protein
MYKLVVALFIACLTISVGAQQRPGKFTAEEIVERLKPEPSSSNFTRGIKVEGQRTQSSANQTIDLEVNFEYASAILSPDARIVLDNLGRALSDPALISSRFLVAGHTDAVGSLSYNLGLSKRRAQAVADYLVREHNVSINRLQIEGVGSMKLLDPANPTGAVNRRVQIATLGM